MYDFAEVYLYEYEDSLIYLYLRQYREGRKSLGTLASDLGLSVSGTIDLLAELGIEAPLDYDDYLRGLETLRQAAGH